jgi:hypothetical protein
MTAILILKMILLCVLALFLLVIIYVFVEIGRILSNIRRIVERIELLTDIRGWFSFFRKFSRTRKSKD